MRAHLRPLRILNVLECLPERARVGEQTPALRVRHRVRQDFRRFRGVEPVDISEALVQSLSARSKFRSLRQRRRPRVLGAPLRAPCLGTPRRRRTRRVRRIDFCSSPAYSGFATFCPLSCTQVTRRFHTPQDSSKLVSATVNSLRSSYASWGSGDDDYCPKGSRGCTTAAC